MALQYMVSIKEGLFTVGLDPHLVLAVLREEVQAGDIELESASLREFAEDGSGGQEVVFSDVSGHLEDICAQVIDSFPMKAENVISILTINKKLDVGTHILGELFKERLCFLLC